MKKLKKSKMFADICVNKLRTNGVIDAVHCDEFTLIGNCGTLTNNCLSIWTFTEDKDIYNRFKFNLIQ